MEEQSQREPLGDHGEPLGDHGEDHREAPSPKSSYIYIREWWIGMSLLIVGECGNFISYGFSPAILVAPLGTVALISNAMIAPAFLGERLRARDIWGLFFSILGTGIILFVSSQTAEPELTPDDIYEAAMQFQFLMYVLFTVGFLIVLLVLSHALHGQSYILVDLVIAAIFAGYTVLSTKGISSILRSYDVRMFGQWITYPLLFVLVSTGILQVQYLNRALSRFDSIEVIPTNFVLFTLSSIIGSSILYNDLERTSFAALAGVLCMFFGVVLITGARRSRPVAEEVSFVVDSEEALLLTVSPESESRASPMNLSPSAAIQVPDRPFSLDSSLHTPLRLPASLTRGLVRRESLDQGPAGIYNTKRSPFLIGATPSSVSKRIKSVINSVGTHEIRRLEMDMMDPTSPRRTSYDQPHDIV